LINQIWFPEGIEMLRNIEKEDLGRIKFALLIDVFYTKVIDSGNLKVCMLCSSIKALFLQNGIVWVTWYGV